MIFREICRDVCALRTQRNACRGNQAGLSSTFDRVAKDLAPCCSAFYSAFEFSPVRSQNGLYSMLLKARSGLGASACYPHLMDLQAKRLVTWHKQIAQFAAKSV